MPLEARNVYFKYGKKSPQILEDFGLAVDRGERLAVFAPSGYGKTTLAMLLAGYLVPQKGEILLDGNPLPKKGVCPVQLICQHPENAVNPRWRMRQVLEEIGELQEDILSLFGIERAWLDRFPRELSGGELQRFCAARAVLSGADYLICDEISTMLDAITQAQIWDVLLKAAKERAMGLIIVTHNRRLADRIADSVIDLTEDFENERQNI
ncbi:MAG: ATP-binding cassette domain-containing protein [Ruminococcus sp.]|nr:ATP-binding cassette domain-containing protein [Ruminococcus sp.]MCM1382403.1 ATP-binding cassette domain-containing protein [Muribaculaceae bacterium]MCM1479689.1 ATP-binding cassette domain-containing protein [Muribaculaceae bacterium]